MGSATISVFIYVLLWQRRYLKNKYKDAQGYIVMKGQDEYEHRLIAKRVLKRNLFPNEVVHHINGVRSDNRLINLCVMDRRQHELVHAWLGWKKKKNGRYPSFQEQKRVLAEEHNGILLEKYLGAALKRYTSAVSPQFEIGKPKIHFVFKSQSPTQKLFSDLRRERNRLAKEKNIPAYLVFKNHTLNQMAEQMPQDANAMVNVTGVTPETFRLYGDQFLAIIWKHKSEAQSKKSGSVP